MTKTAIFLGYKFAVLPVAAELKARGYRTVLAEIEGGFPQVLPEYLAAYRDAIDVSLVVSGWDDPAQVRAAFQQHAEWPPAGIYTQLDEAAVTTAILRQEAGLPSSAPEVLELIVDKLKVRQRLCELGLSRLGVKSGSEIDTLETWPFPGQRAFVKNTHGAGSFGVRGVGSMEQLHAALADLDGVTTSRPSLTQAMRASQERMLEQAAAGTLLSFEAVIADGVCLTIGFTRPHLLESEIGPAAPRPMPGCVHPYRFAAEDTAQQFLSDALHQLGYTDGPVHIELMVDADGHCEIIDLNPRFAGAHCLWAMNGAHEEPVEKLLADWTVGAVDRQAQPRVSGAACLQYFLAPAGTTTLDTLALPSGPDVIWSARFKPDGTPLPNDPLEGGWLGGYLVRGATPDEALAGAASARAEVRVNGSTEVLY